MNNIRQARIDNLVNSIMEMPYGTILNHDDIARLLDVTYGSRQYRDLVYRASQILLERGKHITNVKCVGYVIQEPDSYTGAAVKKISAGKRQLESASKILRYAPVSDMSPEAQVAHRNVTDRTAMLFAAMSGAVTEVKLLANRRQYTIAPRSN